MSVIPARLSAFLKARISLPDRRTPFPSGATTSPSPMAAFPHQAKTSRLAGQAFPAAGTDFPEARISVSSPRSLPASGAACPPLAGTRSSRRRLNAQLRTRHGSRRSTGVQRMTPDQVSPAQGTLVHCRTIFDAVSALIVLFLASERNCRAVTARPAYGNALVERFALQLLEVKAKEILGRRKDIAGLAVVGIDFTVPERNL